MKKRATTREATCSCLIKCLFSCRCFHSFIFTFTKDTKVTKKTLQVVQKAARSVAFCREETKDAGAPAEEDGDEIELETGRGRKIQPVF